MTHIIMTGATGYLGSRLLARLMGQDTDITVLKRASSHLTQASSLAARLTTVDIDGPTGHEALARALEMAGKDTTIIHCATSYGRAGETADEVMDVNYTLPKTILDLVADRGIRMFVNADTVINAGISVYADTKVRFRETLQAYGESGRLKVANLALEHFYGPGDRTIKFPTWLIQQCLKEVPTIPLTHGRQKRDFIYIDDVIEAFEVVLRADLNQSWNTWHVGTRHAVTVREFAKLIKELTGSSSQLDFGAIPHKNTTETENSDPNLFDDTRLGWAPRWDLRRGLVEMINIDRQALEAKPDQ